MSFLHAFALLPDRWRMKLEATSTQLDARREAYMGLSHAPWDQLKRELELFQATESARPRRTT